MKMMFIFISMSSIRNYYKGELTKEEKGKRHLKIMGNYKRLIILSSLFYFISSEVITGTLLSQNANRYNTLWNASSNFKWEIENKN